MIVIIGIAVLILGIYLIHRHLVNKPADEVEVIIKPSTKKTDRPTFTISGQDPIIDPDHEPVKNKSYHIVDEPVEDKTIDVDPKLSLSSVKLKDDVKPKAKTNNTPKKKKRRSKSSQGTK